MAKGTYNIGKRVHRPHHDSSFKSCLCTLLIFLAICLIILLSTLLWTGKSHPKTAEAPPNIAESNKIDRENEEKIITTSTEETINVAYYWPPSVSDESTTSTPNIWNRTTPILVPPTSTTSKTTTTTLRGSLGEPSSLGDVDEPPDTEAPKTISTTTSVPIIPTDYYDISCSNIDCKNTAANILAQINSTIDPCEDFYGFSCGNIIKSNNDNAYLDDLLLMELTKSSTNYYKIMKTFYDSCVEDETNYNYQKRIEKVRQLVQEAGNFSFCQNDTIDLTILVVHLLLTQTMPLFDVTLGDIKQSTNYVPTLTPFENGGLKFGASDWSLYARHRQRCTNRKIVRTRLGYMNLTNIYESYMDCLQNFNFYIDSVEYVLRELGVFSGQPNNGFNEIQKIRQKVEYFIINTIKNILSSQMETTTTYTIWRINDLRTHFFGLNWMHLFTRLMNGTIHPDTLIRVSNSLNLKPFFSKNDTVEQCEIYNALLAVYATNLYDHLVYPPKARQCLEITKKLFPDVIGNLFSTENSQQNLTELYGMFEILREGLKKSINQNDSIIDEIDRIGFIKKLNQLKLVVFDDINPKLLSENYRNIQIDNGNYQENFLKILMNLRQNVYKLIGKQINKWDSFVYFVNPISTTGLVFYSKDLIVVPYGLTQRISADLPGYVQMARIGLNLAKLMVRYFDTFGISHSLDTSNITITAYRDLMLDSLEFFNENTTSVYNDMEMNYNVNSKIFENDMMIENAAFRLLEDTFNLYGDHRLLPTIPIEYSRAKIFYTIVAQEYCKKLDLNEYILAIHEGPHLPPTLSVKNLMMNSKNFSYEFNCPDGAGMDSSTRVQFPYKSIKRL